MNAAGATMGRRGKYPQEKCVAQWAVANSAKSANEPSYLINCTSTDMVLGCKRGNIRSRRKGEGM